MGQLFTRQWKEMEEVAEGHRTPKTTHKLADAEDPRSPTNEIHRTPIEVEDTPNKRSASDSSDPSCGFIDSPTTSRIGKVRSVPESLHKKALRNALGPRNEYEKLTQSPTVDKQHSFVFPETTRETENKRLAQS